MSPSARTLTVLRRFPRHLGVDDPGKLFGSVADGLGRELDVKSAQLGRVRRSHALGDADEERDLLKLAGLHDLHAEDFEITRLRLDAAAAAAAKLSDASTTEAERTAVEAALPDLLGLAKDSFPSWPAEPDPTASRARLGAALGKLASYGSELDLLRGTVESVIRLHREGNGTVPALLGAGATHLQLELDSASVVDAEDRYWHVGMCRDRLRLVRPEPPGTTPSTTELAPKPDLLALEENPLRRQDVDPVERRHADRFHVLRRGFETVPATVRVVGTGARTVAPMVVNLNSGFGLAFTGTVEDGQELRFESDGRVTLGGSSVARLSYTFSGGVFADGGDKIPGVDFVFAGDSPDARAATFAVTQPIEDAFEPTAAFPHTEGLLDAASLRVGESRWAFFVRAAHFGRTAASRPEELAVPVFEAGVFDESVYEPEAGTGKPPSGKVGFTWQEHEPFAVRLWIPMRFSKLDSPDAIPVKERLRLHLDRHRAAGVHVYVEYADDRWTLPAGILRGGDSKEPLGTVIVGTAVWAPDTVQPTPT